MRSEARLLGNVGKVEDKNDRNGNRFITLSIAVDKGYKDKESGEWVEKTEWFRVIKFGGLPENLVKKLKGAKVQIRGELTVQPGKEDEYPQIQIKVLDVDVLSFAKKKDGEE